MRCSVTVTLHEWFSRRSALSCGNAAAATHPRVVVSLIQSSASQLAVRYAGTVRHTTEMTALMFE